MSTSSASDGRPARPEVPMPELPVPEEPDPVGPASGEPGLEGAATDADAIGAPATGAPVAPPADVVFQDEPPDPAVDRPAHVRTVVLDPAWVPGPGTARTTIPLHDGFAEALESHDLFDEALDLVDGWATAVGVADRLMVDGVCYWYRLREEAWHWVHERLLWRYAFERFGDIGPSKAVVVPPSESALADVARALGLAVELAPEPVVEVIAPVVPASAPPPPTSRERSVRGLVPSSIRQRYRRVRPRPEPPAVIERRRREAYLAARWDRLAQLPSPRLLVLSQPLRYQRVGPDEDSPRRDPDLGSVMDVARAGGLEPIVIGWSMNRETADDRPLMDQDDRLMPAYVVAARFGEPADVERAAGVVAGALDRLDAMTCAPLALQGADLGPALLAALRGWVQRIVGVDARDLPRAERFIGELAPAAILTTQEHHRTPWLLAGARAGIPTFAVQHGILYRTHPGYPPRREPGVLLPTTTFVYGEYARRALLAGAYRPDEVEASGSPRLDLGGIDPGAGAASGAGGPGTSGADAPLASDRDEIRHRLGVRDGDRLLVISTVNVPYLRRSHVAHMIIRLLGGPLPGVHLVFKQHPREPDDGPYAGLIGGLAAAGGYEPPPVSVVRDIDLYRLLEAADAHLGLHSTVLTDAVAAGTPNLIAMVEGKADMLDYVSSGVAFPVRDVDAVRAALADPPRPEPAARQAFLADHFRTGDAAPRIVTSIRARIA